MSQDFIDIFSQDFQDHIYPIQERSRNLALIFFDIMDAADAGFFGIFMVPAFTGIHGCDEHKICWIVDSASDSRDHH